MKNKNLLPLLAVAGGLYLANQTGKKTNETDTKTLAFTGDTFADEEALKDALVKVIKANNIELRTLLRGNDGAKGDKGDTGERGLAGNPTFSGSIIGDSALTSLTLADYTGDGALGEDYEGLPTITLSQAKWLYSKYFQINIRRIYVAEFTGKTAGSCICVLSRHDKNKANILNSGDSLLYVANNTFTNNSFAQKKVYFSAQVGTAVNQHNINTVFSRLCFYATTGQSEFSKIVLREIPLGEAVPHNLIYLPEGQTVVDNTTGKVGRYNGSTIDWFM